MTKVASTIQIVLLALISSSPALASDPLGAAGTFRSLGWIQCDRASARTDCNPPAVDPALPPKERSNALVERTIILLGLLRTAEARQSIEAAITADPTNTAALRLRVRMLTPVDLSAAMAYANAALQIAPFDSDLLATRAELLAATDLQAALRDADESLRGASKNADALWIRARILLRLGRLEEAETDLDRALSVEPDVMRARSLRAEIRLKLHRLAEAFDDASMVLETRPGDLAMVRVRAIAQSGANDSEGAVTTLTSVLGAPGEPTQLLHPRSSEVTDLYTMRAMLLARLGHREKALQDLDAIVHGGDRRAILRLQVYLRNNGFPDVPIDGKRTNGFDDAIVACFLDKACGRGVASPI